VDVYDARFILSPHSQFALLDCLTSIACDLLRCNMTHPMACPFCSARAAAVNPARAAPLAGSVGDIATLRQAEAKVKMLKAK
jgi:hypothetical protein